MRIEVEIWNLIDGHIIELRHNDTIYTVKKPRGNNHNVKKCYLEKWIDNNPNMTSFTLDMFYKSYPRQRDNRNLYSNISRLIDKGLLVQMGKDSFKINRGEIKR